MNSSFETQQSNQQLEYSEANRSNYYYQNWLEKPDQIKREIPYKKLFDDLSKVSNQLGILDQRDLYRKGEVANLQMMKHDVENFRQQLYILREENERLEILADKQESQKATMEKLKLEKQALEAKFKSRILQVEASKAKDAKIESLVEQNNKLKVEKGLLQANQLKKQEEGQDLTKVIRAKDAKIDSLVEQNNKLKVEKGLLQTQVEGLKEKDLIIEQVKNETQEFSRQINILRSEAARLLTQKHSKLEQFSQRELVLKRLQSQLLASKKSFKHALIQKLRSILERKNFFAQFDNFCHKIKKQFFDDQQENNILQEREPQTKSQCYKVEPPGRKNVQGPGVFKRTQQLPSRFDLSKQLIGHHYSLPRSSIKKETREEGES